MKKSIVIDSRWPEPARRLLSLVQQTLQVSKLAATRAVQDGCARVNGYIARRPQTLLDLGDRLEIEYEPEDYRPQRRQGSFQPLEVLFEDPHILVVDKPPHLLTVPTPKRERNTLLSLLQRRQERNEPRAATLCCVHRLDRGVSGVLVFAKGVDIAERLRDQFAERKPNRRYIALTRGVVPRDEGTYQSYLATDKSLHRYSTDDPKRGELAITHFRVLERFTDTTLVEVMLETGRRNQIRVQFADGEHPILGDQRYGGPLADHPDWPYRRLALHARTLGLVHPVCGDALEYESPWPPEFRSFVRDAQRRARAGSTDKTDPPTGTRRRKRRQS